MTKIETLDLIRLKNALHFQFAVEVRDLINRSNAEALKINDLFGAFVHLLHDEDLALKKILKSEKTLLIHEADKARDETYSGMVAIVNGNLKHFNHQKKAAARRVKIVIKNYGNLNTMGLNEQTSNLYNLLQDLCSSKYSADITRIGIGEWVEELQNRNSALDALVKERFDESIAKCQIVLKDARLKVDDAYHAIIERINALVVVEGAANYMDFVIPLNTIVAKYKLYTKTHPRHRHDSEDGAEEVPAVEE